MAGDGRAQARHPAIQTPATHHVEGNRRAGRRKPVGEPGCSSFAFRLCGGGRGGGKWVQEGLVKLRMVCTVLMGMRRLRCRAVLCAWQMGSGPQLAGHRPPSGMPSHLFPLY